MSHRKSINKKIAATKAAAQANETITATDNKSKNKKHK